MRRSSGCGTLTMSRLSNGERRSTRWIGCSRFGPPIKYFPFSCEHSPPSSVVPKDGGIFIRRSPVIPSLQRRVGLAPPKCRVGAAHRIRRVRLAAPQGRKPCPLASPKTNPPPPRPHPPHPPSTASPPSTPTLPPKSPKKS